MKKHGKWVWNIGLKKSIVTAKRLCKVEVSKLVRDVHEHYRDTPKAPINLIDADTLDQWVWGRGYT